MGHTNQFKLLFWKNWKLQTRNKGNTFAEVVVPLYLIALTFISSVVFSPDKYLIPERVYEPIKPPSLEAYGGLIGYGPSGDAQTEIFMDRVGGFLNTTGFRPFASEEAFTTEFESLPAELWAGVFFSEDSTGAIKYNLLHNETIYDGVQVPDPSNPKKLLWIPGLDGEKEFNFATSGILELQSAIESAIANRTELPAIQFQRFPAAAEAHVSTIYQYLWPMMLGQALFFTLQAVMTDIGTEKEKQITSHLKMAGMKMKAYWTSWFVYKALFSVVPCLIIPLVCWAVGMITYTNFWFFAFFLWMYALCTISFGFMMGMFFQTQKAAFYAGAILMFLFAMIYYVVEIFMISEGAAKIAVLATFLFCPIPFGHLIWELGLAEAKEVGLQWSMLFDGSKSLSSEGIVYDPSGYVGWAVLFIAIDIFAYFCLAWYLFHVIPDRNGDRRSLCFCCSSRKAEEAERQSNEEGTGEGVAVSGLRKYFKAGDGTDIKAVDDISLFFKKGEITVVLGHNGAGKTTAIKCIVGDLQPTSGTISVDGVDTLANPSFLQEHLGLCSQYDVLYEHLTAQEHLMLWAGIRGIDYEHVRQRAHELLEDVGLGEKAAEPVFTYSGGQKRRLSVALALVGDPTVVLLDEPTTGIDPYNRKKIWDLLVKEKKNRTIVLTTHSMEEADALGDKMFVVKAGKLVAEGTGLELKNLYGIGYHLHVVKSEASFNPEALHNLLKSAVPDVKTLSDVSRETSFALPLHSTDAFPELFQTLQEKSDELGVESFAVSMTTLEECFVKLGEDAKEEEEEDAATKDAVVAVEEEQKEDVVRRSKTRNVSAGQQLKATFQLITMQAKRNPNMPTYVIVYPLLFVIIAGIISMATEPTTVWDAQPIFDPFTALEWNVDVDVGGVCWAEVVLIRIAVAYSDMGIHIPYISDGDAAPLFESIPRYGTAKAPIFDKYPTLSKLNLALLDQQTRDGVERRPAALRIHSSTNVTMLINPHVKYSSRVGYAMLDAAFLKQDNDSTVIHGSFRKLFKGRAALQLTADFRGGGLMYFVGLALISLAALYGEDIVRQKVQGLKTQLLISGLRRSMYWLGHFLAHLFMYIVPALLVVVLMVCFGMDAVMNNSVVPFFFLLFAFGPLVVLFGYVIALPFRSVDVAQEWMPELCSLILSVPWVLTTFGWKDASDTTLNFLCFIPPFAIYRGLGELEAAPKMDRPYSAADTFDPDRNLLWVMLAMLASAVVCVIILYAHDMYGTRLSDWIERQLRRGSKSGRPSTISAGDGCGIGHDGDGQVKAERARIAAGAEDELLVKNVEKIFTLSSGNELVAVRDVSLGVRRSECFGLLGQNGAGKTTLLNCLNGSYIPSRGEASVCGHSLTSSLNQARLHTGICPQFDRLFGMRTWAVLHRSNPRTVSGREHLKVYANIGGVDPATIDQVVEDMLIKMQLLEKADEPCEKYSGGNRRKLSVALALISDPDVVFLDEPSTGMDVSTRRFLWAVIEAEKKVRAVVLTTHSMQEADAASSRIGIMVNGSLRCVGTPQQLKSTYGAEYQLALKVHLPKEEGEQVAVRDAAIAFVREMFPAAKSAGTCSLSQLVFDIPERRIDLGMFFRNVENRKEELGIAEYSITQPTLDQVFLRFAREQAEETS